MPLERGDALLLLAQQGAGGLAEILDGERELERPGRAHAVELGLEKLHQRIGDRLARRAVGQGRGPAFVKKPFTPGLRRRRQ